MFQYDGTKFEEIIRILNLFSYSYILFVWMGEVGCSIYSFICLYLLELYIMIALMLCCNSMPPSSCKDDIGASAICHL